jgi:predicted nucleic acid-binding protein
LGESSAPWAIAWHGLRELWTADRDFGRFPALAARNPLAEAE